MKNYFLLFLALLFTTAVSSQTEIEKVKETVNKSDIEGHMYFLANDLLKGRRTGTLENNIAAAYLGNTLRGYGVLPNPKTGDYFQQVSLRKTAPPEPMYLSIDGEEYEDKLAMSAANLSTTTDLVFLEFGMESDYKGKDVKGKFVVVKAGSEDSPGIRSAFRLRAQKEALAKEKGASGIIELILVNRAMWSRLESWMTSSRLELIKDEKKDEDATFGYVWLLDKGGDLVTKFQTSPTATAKIEMKPSQDEIIMSQNVIGVVEGTDPKLKDEYIIYSGHYDHVGVGRADSKGDTIYNGARDNAVGTTTVLSMAENLAKYPTKRSALFILFTGEEEGLLGSEYYVENPVIPLEKMVYCFNSDNGGYNDTSLTTIIGLTRTTAQKHMVEASKAFGLKAIEDPAPEQGLFDRSDNVNFAAKGIPAPTFSMGFNAFDGDVLKYYHQPGDQANNMDYDYLLKFFRAYVLSGRKIANDSATPFWVQGDKYEKAGKELYGLE